jgi:uncharacterized protein (DUF2225 family)
MGRLLHQIKSEMGEEKKKKQNKAISILWGDLDWISNYLNILPSLYDIH